MKYKERLLLVFAGDAILREKVGYLWGGYILHRSFPRLFSSVLFTSVDLLIKGKAINRRRFSPEQDFAFPPISDEFFVLLFLGVSPIVSPAI